jgi:hypothetical protein
VQYLQVILPSTRHSPTYRLAEAECILCEPHYIFRKLSHCINAKVFSCAVSLFRESRGMEPKLAILFVLIGAIITLSQPSENWRFNWQRVSRSWRRLLSGIFAKTG